MRLLVSGCAAWAALVLLQLVWHAWLAPPVGSPLAPALMLALVPLLLPLLALRQPRRALLWAAIACMFYFCHGVAELLAHPALRLLASLEVALSLVLIICAGCDRPRKAQAKLP